MKYFTNCKNLEELKKEYRRLAVANHPDHGGDVAVMQQINAEYARAFEKLKAAHNVTADDEHKVTETPQEFVEIVDTISGLDGLDIEICGSWIWISGNTYAHKDVLRAAGCKWSAPKKMWYWRHGEAATRHHRGDMTIDDIRRKYGTKPVSGSPRVRLTAAM